MRLGNLNVDNAVVCFRPASLLVESDINRLGMFNLDSINNRENLLLPDGERFC